MLILADSRCLLFFITIEVESTYDVILVSGVQHSDLTIPYKILFLFL